MILTRDSLKQWPVFTALVTPFKEGHVDFSALDRLIDQQVHQRCGLLLFGTTGEAFSLTESERSQILEHALARKKDVPVVVGASGGSVAAAKKTLDDLNSAPIQGIMLSLPPYYKPGPQGQRLFFEEILSYSKFPVILYNQPGRVGVPIAPSVLTALQSHPNVLAIKQSDPSVQVFKELQKAAPNLPFYVGDDSLFHSLRNEKSLGLISVMANAWPEETQLYVKLCVENKTTALTIFKGLEQATNPIPIKRALSLLHGIHPEVRLPLSMDDLTDLPALKRSIEGMKNWMQDMKINS